MKLRQLRRVFLFSWILFGALRAGERIDLNGPWNFAIDPTARGESSGWFKPDSTWNGEKPHSATGWDVAVVPHDFLIDPRYAYTGIAWYRKSIPVPADAGDGRTWWLEFASVFQRCKVWLNGEFIGEHEGGYTPFALAVTKQLKPGRQNFLVVTVDNRVKFRALPGARSGEAVNAGQYPWLNYGGILGDARLVAHPALRIVRQKVETQLHADGTAVVTVRVMMKNDDGTARNVPVTAELMEAGGAGLTEKLTKEALMRAGEEKEVVFTAEVAAGRYARWELKAPRLYVSRVVVGGETHEATFGFRSIEVRDGKFLLNGKAVRLAGANRARGHPVFGGADSDRLVDQDLGLMKAAGLRFARLQHTAPGRNALEWADRNGMLLVLEVGMWGYVSEDQASEELRAQFRAEMHELVVLAQNHPSVVGWSLGNEYESWTPEGIAWTRDMAKFVKELDPTRPVTFAALGKELRDLRVHPELTERAFDHVDFISTNIYFPVVEVAPHLDPVHARWPEKPVFITEYGLRADRVKSEQERLDHFDAMLSLVRARPWICGLSYWSFNDYASRYPGTGEDGYRRWGLVDEHRRPRPLYEHVRARLQHGLDP